MPDESDAYSDAMTATLPGFWALPLLWSAPAAAQTPTTTKILEQSGTYVDGKFDGKIRARMQIPDLAKALKICTGEDITNNRRFPGIREASYAAGNGGTGTLRYVLKTDDVSLLIATIPVRDMGYSLQTWTDRSQESAGVVKALWQNTGTQPDKDAQGNPLTNFQRNDGGWEFRKIPGTANEYEVTWFAKSTVNAASLQSGSGAIPDSTIKSRSLEDATKVVQALAILVR